MNKMAIYSAIVVAGLILVWLANARQQSRPDISPLPAVQQPIPNGEQMQIDGLEFTIPTGWLQETPSSAMRRAQFRLPRVTDDAEDAELAVYNRIGGTVEQNIERWIGQFTQPDGAPTKGQEQTKDFRVNELAVTLLYVSGIYNTRGATMTGSLVKKPDFSLLAAIVTTPAGAYYFKAVGPRKTLQSWARSFDELTQSLKFNG